MNYKNTLNLPRTEFSMKANLPGKEPKILDFWYKEDIYNQVLNKRRGQPPFILHDGPPYSNGPIHMGQALNKVLKDIVIKYKSLTGHYAPFVPGWDTHGLPNEIKAIKKFKLKPHEMEPLELREKCKVSALHYLDIQRGQFKRLGILGDWDNPYVTLDPSYEAAVVRVFMEMAREGFIYRGLKPVYWCTSCETALAEAEIEYKNKTSPSLYIKFELKNPREIFPDFENPVYLLVWTTTPWTLPANAAVALNPDERYCLVVSDGMGLVMAEPLMDHVLDDCGLEKIGVSGSFPGVKLEFCEAFHPFLDRTSRVIMENYVTMDQGTGCVHTAPGHGREDYEAALEYNLPILSPVNEFGVLTADAGPFHGLRFDESDEKIIQYLKKSGHLLNHSTVEHSYPHCWRCGKPVIFRATDQWFVAVDINKLRLKTLEEIDRVEWIPPWGRDRITNMVKERPDWCISRQRVWGVPLPIFKCADCGENILDPDVIENVEKIFACEGSDAWFKKEPDELLPEGYHCPHCSGDDLEKETEIFDVWFEAGVSNEAVLRERPGLQWPADLYLEGSDQHRGWFQLSLLPSMALNGKAPYKRALTHGSVLDEEGRTMHKSLGNVVDPLEIIERHGADILRLYLSSTDYTSDIKIGRKILTRAGDVYRKIRNTLRFILGNLHDFDPDRDMVSDERLEPLDRWILDRKEKLMETVRDFYENYQFHHIPHHLQNFCVNRLSQFYLDIQKDILYADAPDSHRRRSAQTALYLLLEDLTLALAPILSFTAEEVWQSYPPFLRKAPSVMAADFKTRHKEYLDESAQAKWEILIELRDQAYQIIENLRDEKIVNRSDECLVEVFASGRVLEVLKQAPELFKNILKSSQLVVHEESSGIPAQAEASETFPRTAVKVTKFEGPRCPRCRRYFSQLTDKGVCDRCLEALEVFEKNSIPR